MMASCEFAGLELRLFGQVLVLGFVLAVGDLLVARGNVLYWQCLSRGKTLIQRWAVPRPMADYHAQIWRE